MQRTTGKGAQPRGVRGAGGFARRLRLEPLEQRQLLTATVVESSLIPSLLSGAAPPGAAALAIPFSEAVLGADSASNYQLQSNGPDALLDTADDVVVPLTASYDGAAAELRFAPLSAGVYRLTVRDAITDAAGQPLDGDGDGAAGGSWVRDFVATPTSAGALDVSFGDGGKATTQVLLGDYFSQAAQGVAVQADGKILAAGSVFLNDGADVALMRFNADGSLDATFAGDGRRILLRGGVDDRALAIAVQPDGRIVVAGSTASYQVGDFTQFLLARFNSDGSLDASFDGDGVLTTAFGAQNAAAASVAIQADGRIVAAGYVTNNGFALARYNADGSLDASFDGDGRVTTAIHGEGDAAYGVTLQSDGKILAAGTTTSVDTGPDFALVRYNIDGSLDSTFDGDGVASTDLGATTPLSDQAYCVAVQPDGKIVAVGSSYDSASGTGVYDVAVVRYLSDGSLDAAFDGDGRTITAVGVSAGRERGLVLQDDGRLVAGAALDDGSGNSTAFLLVRYNADGGLDATFDGDGLFTARFDGGYGGGYAAALQADGRIVMAGAAQYDAVAFDDDFGLVRCNADGSLDAAFGNGGKTQAGFLSSNDEASSLAVQADGRIVVAGSAGKSISRDIALARYNVDGSLDAAFGGDGKVTTDFGGKDDAAAGVAIQADGKIVVAGSSGDRYSHDFALLRYNADGSLDASLAGAGALTTDFDGGDEAACDLALQADGKILVAGYSYSFVAPSYTPNYQLALVRYLADGSLDTSFDGDGKLLVNLGNRYGAPYAMALTTDGKIVVAGCPASALIVMRFHADGSPDASFDGDGTATVNFALRPASLAIQPDGRILVAGQASSGPSGQIAAARLTAAGALDVSFAGSGALTTEIDALGGSASGAALLADGRIVAVGLAAGDFAVVRYNADGSLDASFDGDGKRTVDFAGSSDYASGVAVQANGQIVAAGSATVEGSRRFALLRLDGAAPADLVSPGGVHFDVVGQDWGAGQLIQAGGAADGLGRLQIQGVDYAPAAVAASANAGQTVVLAPQTMSGLNVHREITVPSSGEADFAHTVDVLENPSAAAITVAVRIVGNLGADAAAAVWTTSDGDASAETTDLWIGLDDADGAGAPAVILYLPGPSSEAPVSVSVASDNVEWTYHVTVPARQTVRLARYTIVAATRATAEVTADGLLAPNAAAMTSCGVYDPAESKFYLKTTNTEGFADLEFAFGAPGWKPLSGDWNDDGRDTIGLFQPAAAQFYLRNSNASGLADVSFGYGDPSQGDQYILVMGDWNGDGVDTVGLYHKPSAAWFLRNSNSQGNADVAFGFGASGSNWTPVVGDWDGDGRDTIGLYDPATGMFYLRNALTTGMADIAFAYGAPGAGWTPLMGDWDGDGRESAAFHQPGAASHFYLRNDFSAGMADVHFGLGFAGCQPLAGNWVGVTSQPLFAPSHVPASLTDAPLTVSVLQPLVNAAIDRWASAGAAPNALDVMSHAQILVADLAGTQLSGIATGQIVVDSNAAGHGWFSDATPRDNVEFRVAAGHEFQAIDPQALDRIDLLTVVEYELGRLAGVDDLAIATSRTASETLATGLRRVVGA